MEDIHKIQSFNWSSSLFTLGLFLLGLFYYLYKFHTSRNLINDNVIPNSQSNYNREDPIYNNPNINNNQNQNQNNQQEDLNDPNLLKLKIIIQGERHAFTVNKDIRMGNFINNNLSTHFNSSTQAIYLIYQGTRLDIKKKFSDYIQIKNDSIIHCFVVNLPSERDQNNENNGNSNNFYNNNQQYYNREINENEINLHTIIFHLIFAIIGIFIIVVYKKIPEVFTKATLIIFGVIFTLWLNQLSKVIAKFIIFRQVNLRF